ncbi:IS3 family transposase [Candidatus Micrarchaeota archaeon]|nr:IS3 family transposase [Candidatus Micrarchaeota archaeon]MBU2475851.1 IS3 family transposase [Candidatus Micrarchaeota archaeon]
MLFENIKSEREKLDIASACRALNVSRSWYTDWINQSGNTKNDDRKLIQQIKQIIGKTRRYGYRRVTAELHRQKIIVNHKKVLKIMGENSILCRKKKAFKPKTTDSNHDLKTYPNLIEDLVVNRLNQVWASDITFVYLENDVVYLATVIDLFSRKCIGWNLRENMETQLCLDALNMALEERKGINLKGLIHHSDQGSQYCSNDYTNELEEQSIKISMSRKATPTDNAHAESFFKTVKYEEVYMNEYQTFDDAYKNIKKFIEEVYNKKRLHSAIGYKPPAEFEQKILKKIVA